MVEVTITFWRDGSSNRKVYQDQSSLKQITDA